MTKVVKWERFYMGESMWEVARKPGVNLLPHELAMVEEPLSDEHSSLVITYSDGNTETHRGRPQ